LQEINQLLQSIEDRFKVIQTRVLAKSVDFKSYVVEIEENVDEEHKSFYMYQLLFTLPVLVICINRCLILL